MFANASLGPALFIKEVREKQMVPLFDVLNDMLSRQPYLQGSEFTVSDIAVGAYLAYLPVFFPDISIASWPKLEAYVNAIRSRPAFMKTVGAPPSSTA